MAYVDGLVRAGSAGGGSGLCISKCLSQAVVGGWLVHCPTLEAQTFRGYRVRNWTLPMLLPSGPHLNDYARMP